MSATSATAIRQVDADSKPTIQVSACQKILVVKLDCVCDFILLTPFLRGLRKSAPKAQITLIVSPEVFPLAEICPFVNRIISAEVKQPKESQLTVEHGGNPSDIEAHQLSCIQKRYDLAIVPRYEDDFKFSSLVAAHSGAKRIVGFSLPADRWATKHDYVKSFYTDVLDRPFVAHEVEHLDALLQYINGITDLGSVDIWTLQDDIDSASLKFQSIGVKADRPVLGVCPGSLDIKKQLPVDKFASILARVAELIPQAQFVILGSASEQVYARAFLSSLPECFSMCGKLSPRESVAAVSLCTAVIAVDSDLAHIAAAVDKPSAVFFRHPADADASSRYSPIRFKPWGKSDCVILQPNHALWPCNLWPTKRGCQAEEPHCITSIIDEYAVHSIVNLVRNQEPIAPSPQEQHAHLIL